MKTNADCASVYTLSDVFENIFYVGCTTQPLEIRLANHISDARCDRGNKTKNARIRSLEYQIFINPVECVYTGNMRRYHIIKVSRKTEFKWILHFHKMGFQLTNGKELEKALRSEAQK